MGFESGYKIRKRRLAINLLIFMISYLFAPTVFADFYSARKASSHIIPVAESVFHLDSSSGRCTATLISNTGHFLTARHCLQRCLIQSGVFVLSSDSPSGVSHYVLNADRLGKASCEVALDGSNSNVTVEATSPGLIIKMDERSFETLDPTLFKDLVKQGFTSEGDFVIFKSSQHQGSNHCLSVTPKPDYLLSASLTNKPELFKNLDYAFVNHHVFSYPSETFRKGTNNSDGKSLYYSFGRYTPSILKNSCLEHHDLTIDQEERLTKIFDMDSSFLSTVDASYGSSGSAVFDDRHTVLGILTNTYRHVSISTQKEDEPELIYCEGSSKALKIDTIFSILNEINYDIRKLSCSSSHL